MRCVANMCDVDLIGRDRVKDKITQTRSNNNSGVWLVCFSSLKGMICQFPGTLDMARTKREAMVGLSRLM
jgi:hypothetical protein